MIILDERDNCLACGDPVDSAESVIAGGYHIECTPDVVVQVHDEVFHVNMKDNPGYYMQAWGLQEPTQCETPEGE